MRTGNLIPTHSLSAVAPRSDGGRVVVAAAVAAAVVAMGAAGRAVPASSWAWRFDCEDEADAARGVSGICRCLPPSLPSPPSQGWHRAPSPWSSVANTSTSTGIRWPWLPATPCPHFCASGWYSHSLTPSPAACCSFKLPSGSLHALPSSHGGPWAPERQTQSVSGCCGRSRLMLLLISPSPRPLSTPQVLYTYLLLSCHGFSHHPEMPVVFVRFHPIINKTYIYTVCGV